MLKKLKKTPFTRNIVLLSAISFFTDVASEMLYPVFPLYFQSIGYSLIMIGFLEGVAEIFAGTFKTISGFYSDKLGNKKIFIILGYGLSAFAKPAIGLTQSFIGITTGRLLDRLGKGIRTTPRDAILAEESSPAQRGLVFGFHRSMDTFGASIGPVITLILIYFFATDYSTIFVYSLIPGILAVILAFLIKRNKQFKTEEANKSDTIPTKQTFSFKQFWHTVGKDYKKLVAGLLFIIFLNSTDMFLLLRARELGASDFMLIVIYIFYNIIFALAAVPIGRLCDKVGFKTVFMFGIALLSLVYGALGMQFTGLVFLFIIFGIYGVFAAMKEGVAKAWVSLYVPQEYMGTGIGVFLTLSSVVFLLGNVTFGYLWTQFGATTAFSITSIACLGGLLYFLSLSSLNARPNETDEDDLAKLGCNSGH